MTNNNRIARYIIVSSGFHNRYHLPAASIMKRYQKIGATVMNTAQSGAITLYRLSNMGFEISIDDFGTGYSSLGRIWHL